MKNFPLILLFIAVSAFSNASVVQRDSVKVPYGSDEAHFMFSGGFSLQKNMLGEAGVIYGYSSQTGPCNPGGIGGIKLASEFNFNPDKFYIGSKIGAVMGVTIFGMGINVIDYTDFHNHDLRLTPEIGLSLDGFVNLLYGYNIPLTNQTLDFVAKDRLTLTVNLDRRMWQYNFRN